VTIVGYHSDRLGVARLRAWYVAVRAWLETIPLSLFLLALRIGVAMIFLNSGRLKLVTWDFTIQLFAEEFRLPVIPPETAATLTALVELTVPPFIIVGLATRLATLPLLGMIAVIQIFVYPDSWPDTLLWGGALLFVLSRGAGVISIDHVIERAIMTRSPRIALLAVGFIATAAAFALWYFAYSSQAHATVACLFSIGPECAGLTGRAPIAPYLPAHPVWVWASLALTAAALVWLAVSREIVLLRGRKWRA
jgi:putative oxidoreductase